MYTNSGEATIHKKVTLPGFGKVWLQSNEILTFLSFHGVKSIPGFDITYNRKVEDVFTVHKPDGAVRGFNNHKSVLYYMDCSPMEGDVMVQTVTGNKKKSPFLM